METSETIQIKFMNDSDQRLARLRKLWCFAKSQKKDKWADQIVKDANKLKESAKNETGSGFETADFMSRQMNTPLTTGLK